MSEEEELVAINEQPGFNTPRKQYQNVQHTGGRWVSNKKNIDKLLQIAKDNPDKTMKEMAEMVGCHAITLVKTLKKHGYSSEDLQSFKKDRADILAIFQAKLLDSLSDEDMDEIHPLSRVKMLEVFHRIERLERGESTENVSSLVAFVEEAHKRAPKDVTP
jgi:hypothetical protein